MIRGGRPVPSSIERLIVKGLTKKPADRYASAEVFLAAVEEALHTPDGGVTEVNFERPGDTGSQPLVDDSGNVGIDDEEDQNRDIGDAIDEVLHQTPTSPVQPVGKAPAGKGKAQTPGRGRPAVSLTGASRAATKLGVEPPTVEPPIVAPGAPRGRQAGGVGIGIPYTGPSGEPIFGLTPEERLAQVPKKKRRWPLYGAILAAALGLGVAIALVTAPGSGGEDKPGADPKLDPASPAGKANDALERGDPAAAVKILDDAKTLIETDPDAQLVLGHARASLHQSAASLTAYRKALHLAPALSSNTTFRANLRAMAADKDAEVVMNALDIWFGSTDDPSAKDAVLKAVVSQSLERRHAARPVVDRYKLSDDVDWVTSYGLDLEQELTCEKRREAVAHLRALNNPKAAYPIERAVVKRLARKNACLLDDAHAAIGVLKQLGPK
jgi:hypothetical protein